VIPLTHDISEAISMTDRVIVLGRRPGHGSLSTGSSFPSVGPADGPRLLPRSGPRSSADYFNVIWEEGSRSVAA